MDFLKLAADRCSVRKFENRHLEKAVLDKILEAGHLAPTACNNQPQRILVLNSDEAVAKLKACTRCHFDAPTALLVCYHKAEQWARKYDGHTSGEVDASIVTTHMMLAAASLGVGSTWVMHFDPAAMRATFCIPHDVEPVALLTLGYPAPDAIPMSLHSTFRPMEEVVYRDSF